MKAHFPVKAASVLLCLGMLFVSGCAGYLRPEKGAVARPDARIAIPGKGERDGTFAAKDVSIVYTLSGVEKPFSLSGAVVFDRSLTNSFPIISSFTLKMSFLDDAGRVLETVDATPVFNTYGRTPEALDFRVTHRAPPGSRAIAFNYFGEFRSNPQESSGTWEVFYFPFD